MLVDDLVAILSKFVGETGKSEGAVEVAERIVAELLAYRAKLDAGAAIKAAEIAALEWAAGECQLWSTAGNAASSIRAEIERRKGGTNEVYRVR